MISPPAKPQGLAWWFVFADAKLLVNPSHALAPIPLLEQLGLFALPESSYSIAIGSLDNIPCYAVSNAQQPALPGFSWQHLKQCGAALSAEFFSMACRARHLLQWDSQHVYCSQCAAKLIPKTAEQAKLCPECQTAYYPRISPSIIVRVKRGADILLARSPHFQLEVYSTLAGFIEPGESAEQAVAREIFEETGIHVQNIAYFGSQPWPFPDSLMLAFTADYAGGEITCDPNEIEDAAWFSLDKLPKLPSPASIAYQLIMNAK